MPSDQILLGQFMSFRRQHPDSSSDPFNPTKAFVDRDIPNPNVKLTAPRPIGPIQPAPALSSPAKDPIQPAPMLTQPTPIVSQPAPALSHPANLPSQPAPPPSMPASIAFEPPPSLSRPAPLAPVLGPTEPHAHPPAPVTSAPPVRPSHAPQSQPSLTIGSYLGPAQKSPAFVPSKPAKLPSPQAELDAYSAQFPPTTPDTIVPDPGQKAALSRAQQFVDDVLSAVETTATEIADQVVSDTQMTIQSEETSLLLDAQNTYGPDSPSSLATVTDADDLADSFFDGRQNPYLVVDPSTGLSRYPQADSLAGPTDLAKKFASNAVSLALPGAAGGIVSDLINGSSPLNILRSGPVGATRLGRAAFPGGLVPALVDGETDYGFGVVDKMGRISVDDDDAYVPLSFTDLRPVGAEFRTVYFRPFIDSLTEAFSPEWNEDQYFGRVDPVATYRSTGRVISLTFKLVCFGPEDLRVIYQKLNWLTSMVYPEYGSDLQYKSGPVIRLRVGNVIDGLDPTGNGTRGLPGIIKGLDIDFGGAPWEIRKDWKVPQRMTVSITFGVLHDMPIGRGVDGKFGGIGSFRNGAYVPPGQSLPASVGASSGDLGPEVYGIQVFRNIGGADADSLNDYNPLLSSPDNSHSSTNGLTGLLPVNKLGTGGVF